MASPLDISGGMGKGFGSISVPQSNKSILRQPMSQIGPDTSQVFALQEDSKTEAEQENQELRSVVAVVRHKYEIAKTKRYQDEQRMLACYRNYRALYNQDNQFSDREKSRVFVPITKTKVLAAHAKVTEVLFSAGKFPIGIEPTPVPDEIAEMVHFDPQEPKTQENEVPQNTIVRKDILDRLGPVRDTLSVIPEGSKDKIKEGPGKTPTAYTWEPANEAARLMEKQIHDQLLEAGASKVLKNAVFDMALFGTGCIKGPFATSKEYPRWSKDGKYDPLVKIVPDSSYVSIWDIYPDPYARSGEQDQLEYMIQRHRLTKTDMRALKRRPHFRPDSIDAAIAHGTNYKNEYWEDVLKDYVNMSTQQDRFEVLEFWGMIDKEFAEQNEIDIPEELQSLDEVQCNIWICNGQLLRFVLNPFTPARIPYYTCQYEINPYSFFGIGVAENMSDLQLLMNGFMRLAVDNAALSSNVIFEVDETNLVPNQTFEIFPGKIFRRQSGAPGQAIFSTKIQNVTQETMLLFDKARQLADEATGIPSFSHGMSGIMSTGRTASGMQMLMGAADENIKQVIRNIDESLLIPWGKGLFAFNMQFNFNEKFIGDLDIVARGTESLMRNEIRTQKILQVLQLSANPMDAPFIRRDYLWRELTASLDFDPDKVVNDPRAAAIQAELIKEMQAKMGPEATAALGGGTATQNTPGIPSASSGANTTGTTGTPAAPGAPGSTASGGGANTPQNAQAQQQKGM